MIWLKEGTIETKICARLTLVIAATLPLPEEVDITVIYYLLQNHREDFNTRWCHRPYVQCGLQQFSHGHDCLEYNRL